MAEDFRAQGELSLIVLSYVADLDAVDAQLNAHVSWLEKHFAAGTFIVAGRRNPRTGGVILAKGRAAAVEALAQTDPFVTSGVALFEVLAFNASFAAGPLVELIG